MSSAADAGLAHPVLGALGFSVAPEHGRAKCPPPKGALPNTPPRISKKTLNLDAGLNFLKTPLRSRVSY